VKRRTFVLVPFALAAAGPAQRAGADAPAFAPVVAGRTLRFPEDEGSHPDFRLEWWYVTGWLEATGAPLGFQVTFFRAGTEHPAANPSRFAPRHLLIAHVALSDPARERLDADQRTARAGFGLAEAATAGMDVYIDDWRLRTEGRAYRCEIGARDFRLDFVFEPTQPPLLQGSAGYSRKGPDPASASYYYTLPQLAVSGRMRRRQGEIPVRGIAWLDHEWSSAPLDAEAVGWDWIGINLDDGGAVMAFRIRARTGAAHWAGGTWRRRDGDVRTFAPGEVRWTPLARWRSPRTGTDYPVAFRVSLGGTELEVEPLMQDQENDARGSAGTIYWEGAVRAKFDGRPAGRGYLELTGYGRPLRL